MKTIPLRCRICGQALTLAEPLCSRCAAAPDPGSIPWPLAFTAFFQGWQLWLRHPSLQRLSLWPALLTGLLFTLVAGLGLWHFNRLVAGWLQQAETVPVIGPLLPFLTMALGSVLALFLMFYLFLPAFSLACIPFIDWLSSTSETLLLGPVPQNPPFSLAQLRFVAREMLLLLTVKVIVIACALPLLLIPVVGGLGFLVIFNLLTTIDFFDVILGRKNYTLPEKIRFLRHNLGALLSFSVPVLLTCWIPLLQLIVIPIASIGAVWLYLRLPKPAPAIHE